MDLNEKKGLTNHRPSMILYIILYFLLESKDSRVEHSWPFSPCRPYAAREYCTQDRPYLLKDSEYDREHVLNQIEYKQHRLRMIGEDWEPPKPSEAADTIHDQYYLGSPDPLIVKQEQEELKERSLKSTQEIKEKEIPKRQKLTKKREIAEEEQKKNCIF